MVNDLFTLLSNALYESTWLALLASFGWGIFSVLLSPCHLTSIPLIVGYISSGKVENFKRGFLLSLLFSIGILVTILIVGIITASLGRMVGDIGVYGNYFVAAIFFIVGLYLFDLINIDFSFNFLTKTSTKGYLGAFILGLLFGFALGPCTFAYMAPVLGLVFQNAQTNLFFALSLLLLFAIGHCSVIVLAGSFTSKLQSYLDWGEKSKKLSYIRKICGVLVILGGIYLVYTTF